MNLLESEISLSSSEKTQSAPLLLSADSQQSLLAMANSVLVLKASITLVLDALFVTTVVLPASEAPMPNATLARPATVSTETTASPALLGVLPAILLPVLIVKQDILWSITPHVSPQQAVYLPLCKPAVVHSAILHVPTPLCTPTGMELVMRRVMLLYRRMMPYLATIKSVSIRAPPHSIYTGTAHASQTVYRPSRQAIKVASCTATSHAM